jgi:hypothetical protein
MEYERTPNRGEPDERETKANPGPEPERLSLDGDWADRVDDALRKKKPADGWPGAKKPGKGKPDKKKSG